MRDLLPDIENWLNAGDQVALATVVSTWGSAPRRVGSHMAINDKSEIAGSVSGGCVEGAVIDAALQALSSNRAQLLHFGVSDESAWDVGLACGGEIDVFVQPADVEAMNLQLPQIKADESITIATVIKDPTERLGAQIIVSKSKPIFISSQLKDFEQATVLDRISVDETARKPYRFILKEGETELFINPLPSSPTLVVVGGVHVAIALTDIARRVHFKTVVIDPRRVFGTSERFGRVDQLIQAWPEKAFKKISLTATTALASLSHDPKIDDPALMLALESPCFYIGALGSKKTQARRLKRLNKKGISNKDLERIQGPIGLEIGAQTPEEIALAIMAQVVADYRS